MDKENTKKYEVGINDLALMCNMLELAANKGSYYIIEMEKYNIDLKDLVFLCNMVEVATQKGSYGLQQASEIWEVVKRIKGEVEKPE